MGDHIVITFPHIEPIETDQYEWKNGGGGRFAVMDLVRVLHWLRQGKTVVLTGYVDAVTEFEMTQWLVNSGVKDAVRDAARDALREYLEQSGLEGK